MAQTFTARAHSRLPESSFPRGEDTFIIHVDPVESEHQGSKRISVGFPVLAVSGWVGGQKDFAKKVAELLTADSAEKAPAPTPTEFQAALDLVCGWADDSVDANCSATLTEAAACVRRGVATAQDREKALTKGAHNLICQALSVRKENTDLWMDAFASDLNAMAEVIGEADRAEYDGRDYMIIVKADAS